MHLYVLVPMLACTISAAAALAVWMRDPGNRRVWPIAGVSACAAVWAFCEIAWNVAVDAASALTWMRISALGWVPIGPVAFHALLVARDRDVGLARSWIAALYAGSAPFTLIQDVNGFTPAPALTYEMSQADIALVE